MATNEHIGDGGPNLAPFQFLDPAYRDFYPDCELSLSGWHRAAAGLISHRRVVRLKSMTFSRLCPKIAISTLS
ncbi:hypothetical protein CFN17_02765 [Arthrobacter sp. PM3]|nr:hypothetical protein CFN17_02765 [Arthrobacter sp. PM3]